MFYVEQIHYNLKSNNVNDGLKIFKSRKMWTYL